MEKYRILISVKAKRQLKSIQKSGNKIEIAKIEKFFLEMESDPRNGLGKPERLKRYTGEIWSRRINKKDRLVYEIFESEILVNVISTLGHYDDR